MNLNNCGQVAVLSILLLGFFVGIDNGGFQYVVLKTANEYGSSQTQMGMLISAKYMAMMLGPLAGGLVSDRMGRWHGIVLTVIIVCVSAFALFTAKSYMLLCLDIFIIGFGIGGMESSCMATLSSYGEAGSGKLLSMFQGFLSAGSVLGPLLASFIVDVLKMNWRVEYLLIGLCTLMAIAALVLLRNNTVFIAKPEAKTVSSSQGEQGIRGNSRIVFAGTLICVLIYMFMENGVTYFSDSFFSIVLRKPEYSAIALSLFWAMMAFSRLGVSAFHKSRNAVIPVFFMLGGLAAFCIGRLDSAVFAVVAVALAGLFFGPLWAFLLNIDTDRFPARTGLVTSVFMIFSGAGGMISPSVMGIISDNSNLRTAFTVLAFMSIAGIVFYIIMVFRYERNK